MLLAIDGPAGAGKSTVARATAHALGYTYLDSGAMYRAVALAGDRDPASLQISFDGDRVLLDGEDVSDAIRTPEISDLASRRAADPTVRAVLLDKQRALLARGDWVAEGRDIGTVVAPDAAVKVFLTADPAERARRRAAELGADPEVVLRDQTLRDEQDRSREHSPLKAAPGAIEVDTTGFSIAIASNTLSLVPPPILSGMTYTAARSRKGRTSSTRPVTRIFGSSRLNAVRAGKGFRPTTVSTTSGHEARIFGRISRTKYFIASSFGSQSIDPLNTRWYGSGFIATFDGRKYSVSTPVGMSRTIGTA